MVCFLVAALETTPPFTLATLNPTSFYNNRPTTISLIAHLEFPRKKSGLVSFVTFFQILSHQGD